MGDYNFIAPIVFVSFVIAIVANLILTFTGI